MADAPRGRALVIGGSLGGLFAANLLLRAGWDVQVHERVAEELEGRGAGIVTHPELLEAMAEAGIPVDDTLGVQVQRRVTLARDGSTSGMREQPQILTAWGRMYQLLRQAFPPERYHNGRTLVRVEQDAVAVRAHFQDGSYDQGDLLVAADGIRSAVRQALAPEVRPRYAGYIAWRGLVDEAALSARTHRDLFEYFAFDIPPHEQMIAYPVAGADNTVRPGHRRYNFVWYRPAGETTALRDLVTDAQGRIWSDGIPPPLIRPEVLEEARRAAREVLSPQFAEVVEKTAQLFFQPIFDLENTRLAHGRIALVGDAAFVARPHCGMGVTKAACDAMALAHALSGAVSGGAGVAAALRAYEQARLGPGQAVVQHARALGAYMQAQISSAAEREMAERYRSPEAVMRETAVPFALHA